MKFRYPVTKGMLDWSYRMLAYRKGIRAGVLAMHRAGCCYASIRYTFTLA